MGCCSSREGPVETLRASPLSILCDNEDIVALSKYMDEIAVKLDGVVPGLQQRGFYLVMEGVIQLSYKSKNITTKQRGDTLGAPLDQKEVARLKHIKGTARESSRLLYLSYSKLQQLQREKAELFAKIKPMFGHTAKSLASVECFEGVSAEHLCLMNHMLCTTALPKGQVLFEEGDMGGSLFILASGAVQAVANVSEAKKKKENKEAGPITTPSNKRRSIISRMPSTNRKSTSDRPNGLELQATKPQRKMLFEFQPGMLFGEIGLVMDIPRTAAIIASKDSVLLELTRDGYSQFKSIIAAGASDGSTAADFQLEKLIKVRVAEHFRKYKVPFFQAIPDNKYATLASFCEIIQLPAGDCVFQEGDPGKAFYMLAHGEVKVSVVKIEKDGKKHVLDLTRMGPGKYFGEVALVTESPRTATITCTKPSVLLVITKANFELFCKEAPEAVADFEIKLARYNVQLRSVLYHPVGMKYFTEHVKQEYSEENIDFWRECRDFRHLTYADINTEPAQFKHMRQGSLVFSQSSPIREKALATEAAFSIAEEDTAIARPGATPDNNSRALQAGEKGDTQVTQQRLRDGFELVADPQTKSLGAVELKELLKIIGLEKISQSLEDEDMQHLLSFLGAEPDDSGVRKVEFAVFAEKLTEAWKKGGGNSASIGGRNEGQIRVRRQSFTASMLWKIHRALADIDFASSKRLFETMDTEKTGQVTFQDFYSVIKAQIRQAAALEAKAAEQKQTGQHWHVKQVRRDLEGRGFVGKEDGVDKTELKRQFQEMDGGKKGYITFVQLVEYTTQQSQQKELFQKMLRRRAVWLYYEFVSNNAPRQVNVQGPHRQAVKAHLESGKMVHTRLFDTLEHEVLGLLSTDTFSRFKSSELFQQFLENVESYTHVKNEEKGGQKEKKKRPRAMRASSMDLDADATISIRDLIKDMGTDGERFLAGDSKLHAVSTSSSPSVATSSGSMDSSIEEKSITVEQTAEKPTTTPTPETADAVTGQGTSKDTTTPTPQATVEKEKEEARQLELGELDMDAVAEISPIAVGQPEKAQSVALDSSLRLPSEPAEGAAALSVDVNSEPKDPLILPLESPSDAGLIGSTVVV